MKSQHARVASIRRHVRISLPRYEANRFREDLQVTLVLSDIHEIVDGDGRTPILIPDYSGIGTGSRVVRAARRTPPRWRRVLRWVRAREETLLRVAAIVAVVLAALQMHFSGGGR